MTNDPNNPITNTGSGQWSESVVGDSQQANLNPVSCDASIEELYGYLDGALDQNRAESIQSHLASCSGCDDVFSFHNRLQNIVGQMGRTEMPTELPQRVFGSILGFLPRDESLLPGNLDDQQSDPLSGPFEI